MCWDHVIEAEQERKPQRPAAKLPAEQPAPTPASIIQDLPQISVTVEAAS
jgi:hypothetical protein